MELRERLARSGGISPPNSTAILRRFLVCFAPPSETSLKYALLNSIPPRPLPSRPPRAQLKSPLLCGAITKYETLPRPARIELQAAPHQMHDPTSLARGSRYPPIRTPPPLLHQPCVRLSLKPRHPKQEIPCTSITSHFQIRRPGD